MSAHEDQDTPSYLVNDIREIQRAMHDLTTEVARMGEQVRQLVEGQKLFSTFETRIRALEVRSEATEQASIQQRTMTRWVVGMMITTTVSAITILLTIVGFVIPHLHWK